MTQFAAVKDKRDVAEDAAATEPATEQLDKGGDKSVALPGLATGPAKKGELAFESTKFEKVSWSWADASGAVKDHARCLGEIAELRKRVGGLNLRPDDRKALTEALNDVEKKLDTLAVKTVSVADRAAAIKTVKDASTKIAAIGEQATEDVKTKVAYDAKVKLAEDEKKKKDAEAKAAEEEKRKKDEEVAKKAEDEKKRKEQEQAAADAKRKSEEEAAKKKADEEAAKKKAADEAAAKKKADDEEAERLAAEAAAKKKQDAEEAAKQRLAAYGDKTDAHAAAVGAAEGPAHAQYEADVGQAGEARKKAIASLPAKQKNAKNATYAQASSDYDKAEASASERKGELKAQIETSLVGVANSASGKALSDADLSWVMTESKGSSGWAQTLADLAAAGGAETAKSIVKLPDAAAIAPRCAQLLRDKVKTELVVRTARLLNKGPGAFTNWLAGLATSPGLEDAVRFAEKFDNARAIVAEVVPVLGTDADAEEFMQAMAKAKGKLTDISWLMSLSAAIGFAALVKEIKRFDVNPAKVRAVHTAAGARFDLVDIAKLCYLLYNRLDEVPAILPQADPHSVSFVKLWLDIGDPEILLQNAIRAEALLMDAARSPGFTITVEKQDLDFGRNGNFAAQNTLNDARTGFLFLNFPNGRPRAKLHSHWNAAGTDKGKISSMHVKIGNENGTELDDWIKFFPLLTKAAVQTHNNETGNKATYKGVKLSLA